MRALAQVHGGNVSWASSLAVRATDTTATATAATHWKSVTVGPHDPGGPAVPVQPDHRVDVVVHDGGGLHVVGPGGPGFEPAHHHGAVGELDPFGDGAGAGDAGHVGVADHEEDTHRNSSEVQSAELDGSQVPGHREGAVDLGRDGDGGGHRVGGEFGGGVHEGVEPVRGVALAGHPGGLLVLQLGQVAAPSDVVDLVLLVEGDDGLGPDLLAAPTRDGLDPGAGVPGGLQRVPHHVAAVVLLRHQAVGVVVVVGAVGFAGPACRAVLAGGVGEHVQVLVGADADGDDAGLVGLLVLGPGRVDADDDADQCRGGLHPVEHVPVPQGAFDVFEDFAVEFLLAHPGAFVPGEDAFGERRCQVGEVGVGGDPGADGARVGEGGFHPFGGQRGGGGDDLRVGAHPQPEQQVVPAFDDERPVRGLVAPGVPELGAAQPVGFFGGEALRDGAVGPGEFLPGRLPQRSLAWSGGGEDAGLAFDHDFAQVGSGGGDERDPADLLGDPVGDFGAGAGLAGAASAGGEPGQPVVAPTRGVLVGSGVLPVPVVVRVAVAAGLFAVELSPGGVLV